MQRRVYVVIGALFLILETCFLISYSSSGSQSKRWRARPLTEVSRKVKMAEIISGFMEACDGFNPAKGDDGVPKLNTQMKQHLDDKGMDFPNHEVPMGDLRKWLWLDDYIVEKMKLQHNHVVKSIPKMPADLLSGRGIVLAGGGELMGEALVAIKYLNQYYPEYPIELWMTREEFEPDFCGQLLGDLNARCMIVEEFFSDYLDGFNYKEWYPIKALALAGSSFAEILFLDVDAFPVAPIEDLMDQEPFTSKGLIVWPDYWVRVTVPQFYEIAGVLDAKDLERIPDSAIFTKTKGVVPYKISSESGQILIDKKKHWRTLMLAVYYNLNGEYWYYPLMNQMRGVPGFGDKDTFISAATVLGLPNYQIQGDIHTLGFRRNGEFHGSVLGQVDPHQDWLKFEEPEPEHNYTLTDPSIAVLHANHMKMNPFRIFNPKFDDDNQRPNLLAFKRRIMGAMSKLAPKFGGTDHEMQMFKALEYVMCEWFAKGTLPNYAKKSDMDFNQMCIDTQDHLKWLKENPDVDDV